MDDNTRRELEKVLEAVSLAEDYHKKINEANSSLHCSDKTLYSPMTTKLMFAKKSLDEMLNPGKEGE